MIENPNIRQLTSDEEIGSDYSIQIFDHYVAYTIPHWHDFFEVEIILEGHGDYHKNGLDFPFSPGLACFMSTTDFHHFNSDPTEDARVIAIGFRENMIGEKLLSQLAEFDHNKYVLLSKEELERAEMAVHLLKHERLMNSSHQSALLEYLLCLVTGITKETDTEPDESSHNFDNVLRYLEWHFRENITLPQLAAQAGYSVTYFSELFQKITGVTFSEKLNNLRLEYARSLLENGYSVTHACFESGFNSLSNFHAAFRKKHHASPGSFKKSSKNPLR